MVVDVDDYGEDPEGAGAEGAGGWEVGGEVSDGSGEGHWMCRARVR